MVIIMLDNVVERGEPAIVVETALVDLLHIPQRPQRRRPVTLVRGSHRLKVIDPDLVRRMQVPARLREERWDMAGRSLGLVVEEGLSVLRGRAVEGALRRFRGR
jgi:hypothetical protein